MRELSNGFANAGTNHFPDQLLAKLNDFKPDSHAAANAKPTKPMVSKIIHDSRQRGFIGPNIFSAYTCYAQSV